MSDLGPKVLIKFQTAKKRVAGYTAGEMCGFPLKVAQSYCDQGVAAFCDPEGKATPGEPNENPHLPLQRVKSVLDKRGDVIEGKEGRYVNQGLLNKAKAMKAPPKDKAVRAAPAAK